MSRPHTIKCIVCNKSIRPWHGKIETYDAHPLTYGRCCNLCYRAQVLPMRACLARVWGGARIEN